MAETAIASLYDLEDYLDTLAQVVLELSKASLYPPDRQALLRQYIHLEDTVIRALIKFIEQKPMEKGRRRLMDMIQGFNRLTADLQEGWTKSVWKEYEYVRSGGHDGRRRLPEQMEADVAALQDLALYLSRLERERRSISKRNSTPASIPHTLSMVDQEAENYKESKRIQPVLPAEEKEERVDKHDCYGCESCRLL